MTAAGTTAVVLVTGVSGSGKSAIARRLTAMGRDAISMDADEQLTGWYDTATGLRTPRPDVPDAAWLARHEWRWNPDRLDAIIADARTRNDVLFLCGLAANGLDLADRFDACLLLEIDRTTMTSGYATPAEATCTAALPHRTTTPSPPTTRSSRPGAGTAPGPSTPPSRSTPWPARSSCPQHQRCTCDRPGCRMTMTLLRASLGVSDRR